MGKSKTKLCSRNKSEEKEEAKLTAKKELRNTNFREWNNKVACGAPRHLYYLVTEKTHHLLACRRKGCPLNTNPGTWPTAQPRTLKTLPIRCDGEALLGEEKGKQMMEEIIPSHLHIF